MITFDLLVLGAIFLGMALSVNTHGPIEYVNSDGTCKTVHAGSICRVDFTPSNDIKKPHVYIDIKGFYSSHRNFAKSLNRKQLRGNTVDSPDSCKPVEDVSDLFAHQRNTIDSTVLPGGATPHPCGQVAKYFFDDTVQVH